MACCSHLVRSDCVIIIVINYDLVIIVTINLIINK